MYTCVSEIERESECICDGEMECVYEIYREIVRVFSKIRKKKVSVCMCVSVCVCVCVNAQTPTPTHTHTHGRKCA